MYEPPPAVYREESDEEQQLLNTAKSALSNCNLTIGRCAYLWTESYANGRTDADFGKMVGMSADLVGKCRRVWEKYSEDLDKYENLTWSHFYTALNWEDSDECLEWAGENAASIAEMKAWRDSQQPEEPAEPEAKPEGTEGSDEPTGAPASGNGNQSGSQTEAGQQPAPSTAGSSSPDGPPPPPIPNPLNKMAEILKWIVEFGGPTNQKKAHSTLKKWLEVLEPEKPARAPKGFTPPTLEEVTAYCQERNNGVDPKQFLDYYTVANWKDQEGKPVKSWKQKMIAVWERKPDEKNGGKNKSAFDEVFGS